MYFPHILCCFLNMGFSEYGCILEYLIVLWGESSKWRGYIIVRYTLHKYHTNKLVTVNKPTVTYWWHGSLLSSRHWGDLRMLVYSGGYPIILHGGSYKCITFKIVIVSTINIRTSWLQWTINRLHNQVRVLYFPPILCCFLNMGVFGTTQLFWEEIVLSVEAL